MGLTVKPVKIGEITSQHSNNCIWVFPKNRGTPKSWGFPYKPSILGYHYFWKHPYDCDNDDDDEDEDDDDGIISFKH